MSEPTGGTSSSVDSRLDLLRWQVGVGTFGVPPAAAPIAFALLVLPSTGSAKAGAALVFAMTGAQALCSVPVARLGRGINSVQYLRALLTIRATALAGLTGLAAFEAPFPSLIATAFVAGAVNGAAFGIQRALLNRLVEPDRLPRALGISATISEVTFALSPVLASLLGAHSPLLAMAVVTVIGISPAILVPNVAQAPADPVTQAVPHRVPAEALLWLFCAAAGSAAVSAVEVGAVSLALNFAVEPGWAFLFATTLCLGSVTGGIWVSLRNRTPNSWQIPAFLAATTTASGLILSNQHLGLSLLGAATIGFFLPSLGTFYSLRLDELAPPHRRAEMFALLRTMVAVGVIVISGLLATWGLTGALIGSFALLLTALTLAAFRAIGLRSSCTGR